jgi:hypothetical protein
MTSTIEHPPSELAQPPDQTPHRNRPLLIAIAVLAVIAVTLGIALVYQSSNDNDGTAAVPEDVQAVLDDFLVAMETYDYEAAQTLVTTNFRRPWYEGDPFGPTPYRAVWTIEDWDFFEDEDPIFEIERVGDPIVRGEGPWYVSVAENWKYPAQQLQYEAIYTYVVVVDSDDVLRIDDAYWAGHGVVMDDEA